MNIRKTQRKNKTKQIVSWPSNDTYFTITDLVAANSHMLTSAEKPSDITIRVRLSKAIAEENLVAVIGQKHSGKGRPQLVFAMRPVKKSVVEKASSEGISTIEMAKIMPVMEITNQSSSVTPTVTPVSNITTPSTVNV